MFGPQCHAELPPHALPLQLTKETAPDYDELFAKAGLYPAFLLQREHLQNEGCLLAMLDGGFDQ